MFASPEPLTLKAMLKLLDTEPREEIEAAIADLRRDYDRPGGLQIVEVAGGYQIVTRPELHEWVRRLFHERTTQKLSVAALETLAVVAYRQPCTRGDVERVRGVDSDYVIRSLLHRRLITEVGRRDTPGRPVLFGTTFTFLERFGLTSLDDLPPLSSDAAQLSALAGTPEAAAADDAPGSVGLAPASDGE